MAAHPPALPCVRAAAPLPARVVDEAIAWAVRLQYNTPDDDTRRDFDRWLRAKPAHAQAWQRVQSLGDDFRAVPPRLALDTLQAAGDQRRRRASSRRRAMQAVGVIGGVGLAGVLAARHAPWQRMVADASTGIGERRTLRLDDGTTVMLNTDTAIQHAARRLTLLRGEVLVAAAHAPAPVPPFAVHTFAGRVHALDARFAVRLEDDAARVSVTDGLAFLQPQAGGRFMVRRGENWRLASGGAERLPQPDFDPVGWADGVIDAHRMRLADFLAELARYRAGHVGCDDRIADLRLNGVYRLDDTDRTLQFLEQTAPVRIVRHTSWWVSVEPAQA